MPHSTIESPRNLPRGQARIRAEVTLFAFACAFVFLAYSLPSVIASNVAKNWPVVEGEVLHSTAVDTAQPVALYRYTVEFHKFVSERVRFEPPGAPLQSRLLPTQIDNVPESKVLVHYDPNRPDQSVLFTEVRPDAWMCLVIGIAALAIGIAGLTAWRRDVADPDYAFAAPRAAAHGASAAHFAVFVVVTTALWQGWLEYQGLFSDPVALGVAIAAFASGVSSLFIRSRLALRVALFVAGMLATAAAAGLGIVWGLIALAPAVAIVTASAATPDRA